MKPTNASSGSSTLALKNAESADFPTDPIVNKVENRAANVRSQSIVVVFSMRSSLHYQIK